MKFRLSVGSNSLLGFALILVTLTGCGEEPTAPVFSEIRAAKGGNGSSGGGGGPTVESTDPSSAPQDTTLEVTVRGSSYDEGSRVDFLLDGKATARVKTNSTRFVSDQELVANITIAFDADPDLYDVQVTTSRGKKGVGIELFAVTLTSVPLEITLRDGVDDGLQSDGLTGLDYCDPGVTCYEEAHDAVGAHLSGNGNLMFWLGQYAKASDPALRHLRVLGELIETRRIYTNDNQDEAGNSGPDIRTLGFGATITSRLVVERGEGRGHLRYGVSCDGNLNERDDAHAIPGERVTVTRTETGWTIEGGNARLCEFSGKGRNATTVETPVSAPFRLTLVATTPLP